MFTLFTKPKKGGKRLEIQLKTQPANKACPPKHISFVSKDIFCHYRKICRSNIQKAYSENAATQSPCQSPGVSATVLFLHIYETLTLTRQFFFSSFFAGTDTVAAVVV